MTLEDFERELAQEQSQRHSSHRSKRKRSRSPDERQERRRHYSRHHDDSKHAHSREDDSHRGTHAHRSGEGHHRRRHREHQAHRSRSRSGSRHRRDDNASQARVLEDGSALETLRARELEEETVDVKPQRMSWMQGDTGDQVEHIRSRRPKTPPGYFRKAVDADQPHKIREIAGTDDPINDTGQNDLASQHDVDYTFGDAGSAWRMKKLDGIYREVEESGKPTEEVALSRYGNLRDFDDAREEEIEVDRRKMYGENYVGKEKPSGELFEERKLDAGLHSRRQEGDRSSSEDEHEAAQAKVMRERSPPAETVPLDQTALNRMKADVMRAKLRNDPKAAEMEAKYDQALADAANTRQPDVVVLNKMENRMLAGGRNGEVKEISGKRGRERGLVEENEDMSIEDMVRQEKRIRGQFGGDGKAFAERIAKDGKYSNDLDYMDDNASKLAKTAQKSDLNLRNTSISEYHKMKRILDSCPLCSHEDTNTPPIAPVVSLGTRTFLTLPTSPEITPNGFCACIVPTQHRLNLLECDDDEWEEIRNFMKSLTRFYYSMKPKRSVIFYENAAHEGRKRHASLEAVPLPISLAETIPQYFKESILSADEEWTQHEKIIDTLKNSERPGFGKQAFRKSMVSELPYFHVWFKIDGGLGHVVEDTRRWPKGDLFAREILGGVLDVAPEVIKRQGRWRKGDPEMQARVKKFKEAWDKWDWTKALMDS